MKKLLISTILVLSIMPLQAAELFVKPRIGYKFEETEVTWFNDQGETNTNHPISCSIDAGIRFMDRKLEVAVSHHSQCFQGFPVNNEAEYSKTEINISYEWRFEL